MILDKFLHYQHKATGGNYRGLGKVHFKHPDTREWVPGFAYTKRRPDGNIWVRTEDDFRERFVRLDVMDREIHD